MSNCMNKSQMVPKNPRPVGMRIPTREWSVTIQRNRPDAALSAVLAPAFAAFHPADCKFLAAWLRNFDIGDSPFDGQKKIAPIEMTEAEGDAERNANAPDCMT